MKLLMTTDCVGGVWTYAIELSRCLARQDVQVVLATMGPPPSDEQCAEAAELRNVRLVESRYRLEWMDEPWDDVRDAGLWLLDLERRFQPDVVHLNGMAHGALPWRAPVLSVVHSCCLSWWRAVKNEPTPPHWNSYRQAVGNGLRSADLVVAPSRAMLAEARRLYGPLPESRVIYNGRDPGPFGAPVAGETPVPPKEEFVFAAGRVWDEAKNLIALAQAAPHLPWPVCVAGEPSDPAGRAVVSPHLHALGRLSQEQMGHWLSRAAIYAHPAKYEPFGLSVLEAAMYGCALVLGDIPSLREIWHDDAVFVPPDDVDVLRQTLAGLIGDESRRRALADRARRRAALFTAEKMTRQYVNAYSGLMRLSDSWHGLPALAADAQRHHNTPALLEL